MAKTLVWQFAEAVDYHGNLLDAASALGLDVQECLYTDEDIPEGIQLKDGSQIFQQDDGVWIHKDTDGSIIGRCRLQGAKA